MLKQVGFERKKKKKVHDVTLHENKEKRLDSRVAREEKKITVGLSYRSIGLVWASLGLLVVISLLGSNSKWKWAQNRPLLGLGPRPN